MASPKMFAEVVIAGSYKGLSKATKGASKEMQTLGGKTQATARLMKGALAGIGFSLITTQLKEMSVQALDDEQSMRLLAKSMDNSIKGQDKLKAGVEDTVSRLSLLAAVTDDEIRPAFAGLIRATKDVKKSSSLMQVSLDVAAGANVSVAAAASAVSRAYNGNYTALNKLAPGIKKLKHPLASVAKRFEGMAKIQGENDPFKQMAITADEAKETIGKVLIPEIKKLASWLKSKEGQKVVKQTTDEVIKLVKAAIKLGKWAFENKEVILGIAVALKGWQITNGVITSWKTLADIWKGMKAPTAGGIPTAGGVGKGGPNVPMQYKKPIGPKALTTVGLASVGAAAGATAVAVYGSTMTQLYNSDKKKFAGEVRRQIRNAVTDYGKTYSATELLTATGTGVGKGSISAGGSNMSNVTINISGVASGNDVLNSLKKVANTRGVPLRQLLG